jgi:hypothetical protein
MFRYDAVYVEDPKGWENIAAGTPVVVIFSLQQQAQYSDPAFIPVRMGEVIKAYAFGSRLFVEFRLTNIVSLAEVTEGSRDSAYAKPVRDFTNYLKERVSTPYGSSAALGAPLPTPVVPGSPWDIKSDQEVLFERAGAYLMRTETFSRARFIRVLSIAEAGATDVLTPTADGVFELHAGHTYELSLLHAQRVAPDKPLPYRIEVDGTTLRTIGRAGFDIASRYDRIVVSISASQPTSGLEDRQTVLTIEPGAGLYGARVEIPIRVLASRTRTAVTAGAQTVGLLMVALASILTSVSSPVRIAAAAVGAVVAATLQALGTAPLRALSLSGGKAGTLSAQAPLGHHGS